MLQRILAVSFLSLACGCNSSGGRTFALSDMAGNDSSFMLMNGSPDFAGATRVPIALAATTKVDILFMVDNSNSMDAMQAELRNRFSQFFQPFQDLADQGVYADLNIGVVTSDYGAGASGAPGCSPSPGGQMGKLQALGVKADSSCQKPTGANFIHFAFPKQGEPDDNNLPRNQNLLETFTCMASVGAMGCGFEHQLESVYAALRNNLPENQSSCGMGACNCQQGATSCGFLRDDALLAVVFVTNEDDSSAPPDAQMFDKNQVAMYGYLDSFRSARFGVTCGDPAALVPYASSNGPLDNCVAAKSPPGLEYDVLRYIKLFTLPASQGGVKADPSRVLVFAIDAPETPFEVILSNPGTITGVPYVECNQLNEQSNPPCVPVLQHSCQNQAQPQFFGDPPIRLNTVVRAVPQHAITSICDTDYTNTLTQIGDRITSLAAGAGCVPFKLAAKPDCECREANGTVIPQCTVNTFPCWKVETKAGCAASSPQSAGITIDRNGQSPPASPATIACFPG